MSSDHLTEPNPKLARLVAITVPGMAHWAGTGPKKKTCGECQHWVDLQCGSRSSKRCEMYKMMTGKWGTKPIDFHTPACKYYEEK